MISRVYKFVAVLFLSTLVYGFSENQYGTAKELKWPGPTIKVAVSASMFSATQAIKPDSDVNGALIRAFQHWESVANINFEIVITDITAISPPGVAGDGISLITIGSDPENTLAFSKKSRDASGLTRVFFDSRGTITEGDIVLNPVQFFTTDQTPGTFDLETVLSHEIGHLLGLSHSMDPSALMFDGIGRNSLNVTFGSSKILSQDDISRVRGVYGHGENFDSCCVTFRGKLSGLSEGSGKYLVWLQNAKNGSLVQVKSVEGKSSFRFDGIEQGQYRILAQGGIKEGSSSSAIISAIKPAGEDSTIAIPGRMQPVPFDPRFIGMDGQLSRRAVNVKAGNTYRIVIAGAGLFRTDLSYGSSSDGISLEPINATSAGFGADVPHRFFDLVISKFVQPGSYSIFVEARNGSRRYLVGAISVH